MGDNTVNNNKTNSMAVVSLVLSFFFPLVGLILGIVSLSKIGKTKESGKGLAIAAIIISIALMLFQAMFLVLIIGGTKSAIESTENKSSQIQSDNKTYKFDDRADKQATDIEVLPNEVAEINGVTMSVTSVRYATSLGEYETAGSGKTYVVADVSLENTSDKTQPYSSYDFRMQTSGGQVLDSTIAFSIEDTLDSADLVTGGKTSGKVVFEVPVEEGHQYIIWKPGFDSARAIVQVK
jgi:hypothetical protein